MAKIEEQQRAEKSLKDHYLGVGTRIFGVVMRVTEGGRRKVRYLVATRDGRVEDITGLISIVLGVTRNLDTGTISGVDHHTIIYNLGEVLYGDGHAFHYTQM